MLVDNHLIWLRVTIGVDVAELVTMNALRSGPQRARALVAVRSRFSAFHSFPRLAS